MLTPNMGNAPPVGRKWAADNGKFSPTYAYSNERYLAWLDSNSPERCLFAVAPDVVGNAEETLKLSIPMLPVLWAHGYAPAFAAQDGLVLPPWDLFYCFFIGGTNAFKLGTVARELSLEARRRGKWVHMGRVNSLKRMRYAKQIGCHSVDGTFLKYGPEKNAPRLRKWLQTLKDEPEFSVQPSDELWLAAE